VISPDQVNTALRRKRSGLWISSLCHSTTRRVVAASTLDEQAMSRYRTQSPDTSFDAERVLVRRYRAMSPAEKLRIFRQLSRTTQELALAGLRRRFPQASTRELQLRLAATRLDRETLRAAFGWSDDQ
jgi:hypothetical protein